MIWPKVLPLKNTRQEINEKVFVNVLTVIFRLICRLNKIFTSQCRTYLKLENILITRKFEQDWNFAMYVCNFLSTITQRKWLSWHVMNMYYQLKPYNGVWLGWGWGWGVDCSATLGWQRCRFSFRVTTTVICFLYKVKGKFCKRRKAFFYLLFLLVYV